MDETTPNLDCNHTDKSLQGDTYFCSTGTGLDNTINLNHTHIQYNLYNFIFCTSVFNLGFAYTVGQARTGYDN